MVLHRHDGDLGACNRQDCKENAICIYKQRGACDVTALHCGVLRHTWHDALASQADTPDVILSLDGSITESTVRLNFLWFIAFRGELCVMCPRREL